MESKQKIQSLIHVYAHLLVTKDTFKCENIYRYFNTTESIDDLFAINKYINTNIYFNILVASHCNFVII